MSKRVVKSEVRLWGASHSRAGLRYINIHQSKVRSYRFCDSIEPYARPEASNRTLYLQSEFWSHLSDKPLLYGEGLLFHPTSLSFSCLFCFFVCFCFSLWLRNDVSIRVISLHHDTDSVVYTDKSNNPHHYWIFLVIARDRDKHAERESIFSLANTNVFAVFILTWA